MNNSSPPFDRRSALHLPAQKHWYWNTLLRAWPLYSEILPASLLINLFALAIPLFVMNVYDRIVPNRALESLWALAAGAVIVFCFEFLMRSLRAYFADLAGKRTDIDLAKKIFNHVLHLRSASQPESCGAFAGHLHEFDSFREFFTSGILITLTDTPFILLFIALIAWLGGPLMWVPLTAIPVVLLLGILVQFPLRRAVQQTMRAGAQKQALLIETLTALDTIKTNNAQNKFQQRWQELTAEIANSGLSSRIYANLAVNSSLIAQQLAYVTVVVWGVYLISDGNLSMGGLIACTILTGRSLSPLSQLASLLTRYQQAKSALRGLNHIMAAPAETSEKREALERPPLQGNIQLRNIEFSYPGQTLPALGNISFTINAGERIAIVGRSGSGKSTLAKLLVLLYQAQSGDILFDRINSRRLEPAALRGQIGYLPQQVELFYGTVRDNVSLPCTESSDRQLLQAATLTGLEFILNRHPLGFDMPVGENGAGLSGGQKQLIGLTRTLVKDVPILILDEPTNALDYQSEEYFKSRFQQSLQNKTLILITHKPSLLDLVDRLIVMDNGQVVADGEKQQILQALNAGKIKTVNP